MGPAKALTAELQNDTGDPPKMWIYDMSNLAEGDVVGVAFGQCDLPNLSFWHNDKRVHEVKKIGGSVYPCCSVGNGAVVQAIFDPAEFAHAPPPTFQGLLVVRSIL